MHSVELPEGKWAAAPSIIRKGTAMALSYESPTHPVLGIMGTGPTT